MPDTKTKTYAIIGNPVEHSMSPAIHNAAFQKEKINAVYLAYKTQDVEGAVRGMRSLGISGFSVTIPHKIEVMKYLDEIDPTAEKIGAVNTIVNNDGKLFGTNTDGKGAFRAIKEAGVKLDNGKCVILGSGGAARAIAFTIAAESKINEIAVLGVNEKEYKSLAKEITKKTNVNVIPAHIESIDDHIQTAKILINCSPIGMHPNVDDSPVNKKSLFKKLCVFDIVYNPIKTKLLKLAKAKACKIIYGTEMFLNQAVLQFELWTGKKAPIKTMRKILMSKLNG